MRFVAAFGGCVLMLACAPEPGRFDVSFVWEEGPPGEEYQVCARLEPEAGGSAITLAPATYTPGQGEIRLAVPAVPHGVAHSVVVDVARECGAHVKYHGRSHLFLVETGARLHYGPRVVLERTPYVSGAGLEMASAASAADGGIGRVGAAEVDLRLWPEKATRVTVALDQNFTVGAEERALSELSGNDNPRTWSAWNLCGSGVAALACEDGLKHVFVKLANDAGLPSEPLAASVILDTRPPALEQLSVEPAIARAGARLAIRLTADEPLGRCPELRVEAPLELSACVSGAAEPQRCEWCAEIDAGVPEGTYAFSGELTDRVGHVSPAFAGSIQIDQTEPELAEPAALVSAAARVSSEGLPLLRAGETLEITFEVAEPLAQPARVDVEGQALACDPPEVGAAGGRERYRCRFEARAGMGDGPRSVSAILQDHAGHTSRVELGTLVLDVDLPRTVDTALVRDPHYPPAIGDGAVAFSPTDPFTSRPVTARLTLFASKLPELEPVLGAWRMEGSCGARPAAAPSLGFHRCNVETDGACPADARVLEYVYAVESGAEPGEYCLAISYRNVNGDSADELLPVRLFLDTAAPANAVDFAETVNVRVPWGAEHSGGQPSFSVLGRTLPGGLTSFPSRAGEIVVSTGPTISGLVGRGVPGVAGEFAVTSSGGDHVDLYAASISQSGKVSAFARITHGEWVATLGGKVPGSSFENPHRAFAWGSAPRVLEPDHPGVEISGAEWGSSADQSVSTYARLRWREHPNEAVRPPARSQHAMAYDVARGKTVLFGGMGIDGQPLADTWEWDGQRWSHVEPALGIAPEARFGHALAYHAASGFVFLFGGRGAQSNLSDSWIWDGRRWQNVSSEVAPPPRREHALAYDPERGRVVLFSGFLDSVQSADTWEWDGLRWHELTGTGEAPSSRFGHALAYDAGLERVVLVGGKSDEGFRGDRWLWDGSAWEPAGPLAPPFVSDHALVFDVGNAELLLFGGTTCPFPPFFDALEFSCFLPPSLAPELLRAGTGEPLLALGSSPSARRNHAMAYDASRGRVVLFGGRTFDVPTSALDDTWEWDGAARVWREVAPAVVESPSARHSHAMAYLEAADRVVSFGGRLPGDADSSETWLWDGLRWQNLSGALPAPPARRAHALSHDPTRGLLLLFGGFSGTEPLADLWSFEAAAPGAEPWSLLDPGSALPCPDPLAPCPRQGHALAHDGSRMLLSSGGPGGAETATGDLWGWDGEWQDLGVSAPSDCGGEIAPCPRAGHAFVCAEAGPTEADCTLFGGATPNGSILGDTWTWNGQRFRREPRTESQPGSRARASFTFDSQRGRALLFGGSTSGSDQDDAWEWDGSRWRDLSPLSGAVRPPARSAHAAAFSPVRGEGVVSGGLRQDQPLADTWLWQGPDAPAHSIVIALAALAESSRLNPAAQPSGAASALTLDRVTVGARTGGSGDGGVPGAELHAWTPFGWSPSSAGNAAPESAPAPLCGSFAAEPGRVLGARLGDELHFQLRPVRDTGAGDPARLVTDYVEVRVAYHLGDAPPATRRGPSTLCP